MLNLDGEEISKVLTPNKNRGVESNGKENSKRKTKNERN